MAEYIEREAFIAEKRKQYCENCDRRKGMKNGKLRFCYEIGGAACKACGINDMLDDVEAVPASDVRPVVRGKWITHQRETWIGVDINGKETQPRQFFAYECPFCGFTTGISGKDYNFCPNCGADMREES